MVSQKTLYARSVNLLERGVFRVRCSYGNFAMTTQMNNYADVISLQIDEICKNL